jgi:hypothetical protein
MLRPGMPSSLQALQTSRCDNSEIGVAAVIPFLNICAGFHQRLRPQSPHSIFNDVT